MYQGDGGAIKSNTFGAMTLNNNNNNISQDKKVRSFANDTRATRGVATLADTICPQEDLNKNTNMKLNDEKFEVLRYGTINALKESTTYTTPKGLPKEAKTKVKDLGVVMSMTTNSTNRLITSSQKQKTWHPGYSEPSAQESGYQC